MVSARSDIVLFFGAGVTAPLGKLVMGPFVEQLKTNDKIGLSLLFLEIADKQLDLEFLLEELGDLESKAYISIDPNASASAGHNPNQIAHLRNQKNNFISRTAQTAKGLREEIERQVFYSYRGFGDPAKVGPHFLPLFAAINEALPRGQAMEVFTTNYDPGVELFCAQNSGKFALNDGFRLNSFSGQLEWDREVMDSVSGSNGDTRRNIFLSKLHGSTTWFRNNNAIIKGMGVLTPTDPLYKNLLIYPARTKVAVEEPFFSLYCRLQRVLESSKIIIAVGYSFRDEDALTRLRAAQRVNAGLKVVVIDPVAKIIVDKLRGRGLTNVSEISGSYDPNNSEFSSLISSLRMELMLS